MNREDLKLIKGLRKLGDSYKSIGVIYNVTPERIRQIIKNDNIVYKKCKKHKCQYVDVCSYCYISDKYSKVLKRMGKKKLFIEIDRLKDSGKRKYFVIQKSLLVKELRDRYKMSFPEIANEFDCHHSSIMYLYYKKI